MNDSGNPDNNHPGSGKIVSANAGENPPPAQPATGQQLQTAEQNIESRMSAFERSMVRLTWAAVAISIVTGIVFAGQLYEMISGGTQTDKLVNYARAQANASSNQADAAQQFSDTAEDINGRMSDAVDQLQAAADNAKHGLEATQQAMRLDQRAWVATERISTTPKLDISKEFDVEVALKNTGKTPAKNVVMIARWDATPEGIKPNYATEEGDKNRVKGVFISRALIAPNAEYFRKIEPFQPILDSFDTSESLSVEAKEIGKKSYLKMFTDGAVVLYIHGRIDYEDIFHCRHWTTFCSQLVLDHEKATTNVCEEHNDTDDQACPISENATFRRR